MPKFSVIIAAYNQAQFIEAAINSVLGQTFRDFELIIVDDGSTDATSRIVEYYSQKFSDLIHSIRFSVNYGQAVAWNTGIEKASGEFVAFLDSDDIWFSHKLETVMNTFGDPEEVVMHQHNLWIMECLRLTKTRFCDTILLGDQFKELGNRGDLGSLSSQAPSSGLTFTANVLEKIGSIPTAFQVSSDAFLRRAAIGYGRVSGLDECLGAYRVHGSNQNYQNREFDTDLFVGQLLRPELNYFYNRNNINIQLEELPKFTSMAFLNLREGDRVLIVRSVPPYRMKAIVSGIQELFPDTELDLLVQKDVENEFNSFSMHKIIIDTGMMSRDLFSPDTRSMISKRNHACVLIPYLNETGIGYENVEDAVISFKLSCPVFGIGLGGTLTVKKHRLHQNKKQARDVSHPAWSWQALRNKCSGQRAFVIGNGPSLKIEDLDRLKNEITFASNKIYLAFESTDWRPTYYTVTDQLVAANNCDQIRQLDIPMLLPTSVRAYGIASEQTLWYRESGYNSYLDGLSPEQLDGASPRFTRDAVFPIHGGYTVIYHQLQLAWHMGIRNIYLLGVDFSFSIPPKTILDERFKIEEYRNALVSNGECNHFHPKYRSPGETWSKPRLDLQACAFRAARVIFEAENGFLKNASRKTALRELPIENFDTLFS